MANRFLRTFIIIVVFIIAVTSLIVLNPPARAYVDPYTGDWLSTGGFGPRPDQSLVDSNALKGDIIMGKLGNATAKAELGRATWKLMHTMTLRFPEEPTEDERAALKSYFFLQARLYPCGECAAEFMQLLKKNPPQTSSRMVASLWLCYVHNLVNKRLAKPEFDCMKLDETYDCGCGDTPIASNKTVDKLAPLPGMIKGG